MGDGILKGEFVNPGDFDQDNGTKLLNYCISIGPEQVTDYVRNRDFNPLMVMNELSSQSSSASECAQTNSARVQDFDRNGYKRVLLA
ncbi:hypothetical protein TNCV_1075111 [Trichonephila clavipes]|uniref:Uncharacterized protein n=1 Tax=Trichonephila clavipes TaxID=2585209 RepID=A0A8X6ST49_TRICX|nr:hypothetical protein TNCV_1075111 [Trichonephila clavipes]